MFLIKAAFWLALVILLIPADRQSGTEAPSVTAFEALHAVRATLADMSAFCERNPDVCVTGGAAVELFAEKAQSGLQMLYRHFGPGTDEERDDAARGTLKPEDVAPTWRGPADDDTAV